MKNSGMQRAASPALSALRINLFLHDSCEAEEKKSQIFSLPLHNYRVKRDLSEVLKVLGTPPFAFHYFSCMIYIKEIGVALLSIP
jgi:hypothetical protein